MNCVTKIEWIDRLRQCSPGQEHLVAFWDELDAGGRERLARQIQEIDFDQLAKLYHGHDRGPNWQELAARAEPPPAFRIDESDNRFTAREARDRGEAALRAGRVGMILVAGGQGTRLGFDHPKGMFPIGPVSGRSLFQVLIDLLRAVSRRSGMCIPLYVMTSPATHDETVRFLDDHACFGLDPERLRIFCQGTMPAVDAQSGRVLLEERGAIALSPDGHGGMLAALDRSGCLADAKSRGIEQFFYGQVDNPLSQVCSPELIGYHLLADSEMTTQVVRKRDPLERVGNVVLLDGRTQIIEYSDLPEAIARRQNADGSLKLWAGNLAVHVIHRALLDRMAQQADSLPFHRAKKKTPFVDEQGRRVEPQSPNSIKFERFVFDLLPAARNASVVEADAAEAFAPVKNGNQEATDTPATAQAALIAQHSRWLRAAGVVVDDGVPVEIHPLFALDAAELATKISPGGRVSRPKYFAPE